MLDSTGKASCKHVSCMWETTTFFPCSALNSDNENFPEGIAPYPLSRAQCWSYGSRYLSWSRNAEVNSQVDYRGGSNRSHGFLCYFVFYLDQMRWSPRNKSTNPCKGFIPGWIFKDKPAPGLEHKSEVVAVTLHNKMQRKRQIGKQSGSLSSFAGEYL